MSILDKAVNPTSLEALLDADFDTIVQDFAREALIPGVSIAVHRHAELHQASTTVFRSYGVAYDDEPVTQDMRFPICSMTKHIVSLALLRLLNQRGANEDTLVRDVLPQFRLSNESNEHPAITFAHILSHTTGIKTFNAGWNEILATGISFYDYLAQLPSFARPGTHFSYANTMYDVCVLAIQELSGLDIESYLRRIFFLPLGMDSTSYKGEGREDAAEGHIRLEGEDGEANPTVQVVPFGAKYGFQSVASSVACRGSGGLISCARDMAKWIAYLPTDPFYPSIAKPLIPAYDPVRPGNSILDKGENYGLGMFIGSYRSVPYVEQWAAVAGFSGLISHFPALGLSVVSMSNSWEGREIGNFIVATMINKVSARDIAASLHMERRQRLLSSSAKYEFVQGLESSQATNIVGSYIGAGFGKLVFTASSNVTIRPQCDNLPWIPWLHGDTKLIVTYLGDGRYAGCLEYRQWKRDSEERSSVRYGYPFKLERRDDGSIWAVEFPDAAPFPLRLIDQ